VAKEISLGDDLANEPGRIISDGVTVDLGGTPPAAHLTPGTRKAVRQLVDTRLRTVGGPTM